MIDSAAADDAFDPLRNWLIDRRLAMDLSRSEVAHRMGLRRPDQLRAWEQGENIPTIMWLARWCRALKSSIGIWEDPE